MHQPEDRVWLGHAYSSARVVGMGAQLADEIGDGVDKPASSRRDRRDVEARGDDVLGDALRMNWQERAFVQRHLLPRQMTQLSLYF